ncbi:alcohol dehydrogenase catalytic domain-containing protein [bacterium]|nr:alcohol dehydrogenase catalytic domain-containing protein [bacterium]
MNTKIDVPEKMLAWQLFGAGMNTFGENEKPSLIPVPDYSDDQLLMKVEAIGLCFSDVKLIRAGEEHPRVIVDDLKKEPVIPGHEAVLSVVGIGANLADKFEIGERFIIQADIFVNGKGLAYGYAINGGMAQYSVMTEPILNGDDGCYLLKITDNLTVSEAALIEPWTCVIAAYRINFRTEIKNGGLMRIVGDGQPSNKLIANLISKNNVPERIVISNIDSKLKNEIELLAAEYNVNVENDDNCDEPADDLIVVGDHTVERIETLSRQLTMYGVFCLAGDYDSLEADIDVGSIHYKAWRYVGTKSNDVADAYKNNTRKTIKKDGCVWLPGGAGAMGQMHTQLALEMDDGPKKVVVTDMDDNRLEKLKLHLKGKADAKGIEFITLNPKNFENEDAFNSKLYELSEGGFEDIVMLVPVPAVLAGAAKMLGEDGLMNIFAGIPAGKSATVNIGKVVSRGQRFIGSSGSSMDDIRHTLELTETGKLAPVYALAAVGGMDSLKEGMQALIDAKFAGKTVVYPHAVDLPLTTVVDIESVCEGSAATLENGEILTKETEKMIRDKWEQ